MSKIKRLAGDTVLYGLGSIVPRFLNFLLVGLHTRVFLPEAYGDITYLMSFVGVINVVYMFGMETAYFRFATREGGDERRVFNLAQTVVVGISIVLSLLFILGATPIVNHLHMQGHEIYIYWLSAIMFIDAVVAIPFARLRLQRKGKVFAIGKLVNVGIVVGLNIYFLVIAYQPSRGVEFVFLANLLANLFYVALLWRSLASWRPAIDPQITRALLSYGYPVMLMGLAGMTNEMFSRVTLEAWLPPGFYEGQTSKYALGIFGACIKFAVLMNLAVQAFRYAAEPFFFSHAADKNSPELFARINHYFIIVCCFILLGVGINLDLVKYFVGKEYWQGLVIVPIMLLAYLFLGVYYNFTVWFKLTDRTYFGTIITVGGAVITIAANYILIPVAGYMGSTWATLLCYVSMAVACYLLGQKFYPIPYRVAAGLAYIVATTGLVYGVNAITIENDVLALFFHVLVVLACGFIVYRLERQEFKRLL